MAEVKEKRRGRPPGSKNRVKKEPVAKSVSRSNGVRKTRIPKPSFLQVNPKHIKLIQKWSNDTKIGMQQILDDMLLAGANTAYKSFYRGLINSRKAAEVQFDAETDIERVATKTGSESKRNRSIDTESHQQDVRSGMPHGGTISQQLDPASVGSGQLEEIGTDPGEFVGVIDAPPATPPEEEQIEEDEDTEPPY